MTLAVSISARGMAWEMDERKGSSLTPFGAPTQNRAIEIEYDITEDTGTLVQDILDYMGCS